MRWSSVVLCSLIGCSASEGDGDQPQPTEPDTTVFDACMDFASRLCEGAQGCCEQVYGAFLQDQCVAAFERDVCRPGASAVMAKRATFDESAIEPCLAAHAASHAVCVPTWAQALELRREIYTACRVIDGLSEPGQGCSSAATCKRPEGFATADCVKNVCIVVELLPEGAACPFPDGYVPVCDSGLACDAPGRGTMGTCVKAVATGETCDASVLEGTDCGLGSYCDPDTAQCAVATNMGGKGCRQSNECVSFSCNRADDECLPARAVIARDTCLGEDQLL